MKKKDKNDKRHNQRDSRSPNKNDKINRSPNMKDKDYLEKRRRVRSNSRSAYIDMKVIFIFLN